MDEPAAPHPRLLESVRKHGVPAVGFVNEGKLFARDAGPSEVEGRTALLRMWLDAGLELGNHTYSHRDLNRLPLDEFQADVIRGEAVTRKLLAEREARCATFATPSFTSATSCRSAAPSRRSWPPTDTPSPP